MNQPWSKIRKTLEQDRLCESLRGRVQYFATRYHGAPDRYGRFSVRVDGEEVLHANPYNEGYAYELAARLRGELGVPRRQWGDDGTILYDEENIAVENRAAAQMMLEDKMADWQAYSAIEDYLQMDIAAALVSENPMIRVLAVLDRRVGRRTLEKLADELEQQPEWAQYFYRLRMDAEDVKYQDK